MRHLLQGAPLRTALAGSALSVALATAAAAQDRAALTRQVLAAESSFAATMAQRDFAAFGAFVADDALFFPRQGVLRGKASVLEAWRRYFEGPNAPFSWRPETVEVLDDGSLALTSGPVFDPGGRVVSTFSSIWRREADGRWRVIFDRGCPVCDGAP
jgi:ketosteroid isomerase-like protein